MFLVAYWHLIWATGDKKSVSHIEVFNLFWSDFMHLIWLYVHHICVHCFVFGLPVFPALLVEEVSLAPLHIVPLLKINWLYIHAGLFLNFQFNFIDQRFVFIPVPQCFNYYQFVVKFEVGNNYANHFNPH